VERATVRLFYGQGSEDSFLITGTDFDLDESQPAVPTLKVYELNAAIVTQPGPTVLAPSI
jgi:hypothetical protein